MSHDRFEFGKNWQEFANIIDSERIDAAKESLLKLTGYESLNGKKFLDIGSGSGLFSLAARLLGAEVVSFDYDEDSVICTKETKIKFLSEDAGWQVLHGSILDESFIRSLGDFDIVYSWGVLHHTGQMWKAIEIASGCVKSKGAFCIAIYNDQGVASRCWNFIKKSYQKLGPTGRFFLVLAVGVISELGAGLLRLVQLKNPIPFEKIRSIKTNRGMNWWYDLIDWVGGYPFEVAKPDKILEFLYSKGFVLEYLVSKGIGQGCCEYRFKRI